MKMICFIVFIFFSLQPYAFLANADISNSLAIEKNTQAIEDLFHQNKEQLPADYLRAVSSEIIEQRAHYSNNTIAKVFILLADLADNQSDSERFSQFAHDGLMLTTIDFSLKLNLLLKVASGYYAKGHYHKILTVSNEAITLAQSSGNTKYHLLALAYRSIGYALINNYPEAFNDLINVESLIERNQTFSDNIDILEIISIANYYLGDYQTMLMINQKILKLRFNLSLKSHLVRTYYHIGIAYHRLGLFDEAYNAYWETKQYAKDKSSKVDLAYAELGLGEILLLQKNHQTSYSALIRAEQLFKESNLPKPYLSTLIALSKSSLFIGREAYAYQLLKQAEKMIPGMELTNEQIELYLLLSAMYQSKKNHPKALELLNRYIQSNKHFIDKKLSNILLRAGHIPEQDIKRQLMSELAKKSELYSAFYKKYQQQKLMLITLVMVLSFIIFFIIIYALRQRSKKINTAYDEVEKPLYFLESSIKTKQMYQSAYKQARK